MYKTKHQIEDCLLDIAHWMNKNKLKWNPDKTELLLFDLKYPTFRHFPCVWKLLLRLFPAKKIIGATFDSTMSLSAHIGSICKSAFFQLRNIAKIRKYLSIKTTETIIIIHAFVTSKWTTAIPFYVASPNYELQRLQQELNAAAHILTCRHNYDHVTTVLVLCLPLENWIMFKIILSTFIWIPLFCSSCTTSTEFASTEHREVWLLSNF